MDPVAPKIENIRLLGRAELVGGCYFEFAPGPYTGQHWGADFVYLEEDVFLLFEPVFRKVLDGFGGYSPNEISGGNWRLIVAELQKLGELLEKAGSPAGARSLMRLAIDLEPLFFEHFEELRRAVVKLIDELIEWVESNLRTHHKISILGI